MSIQWRLIFFKEEKKAKKVADEVKRIEMEKAAEKEAMKEARRVAAREEAKVRAATQSINLSNETLNFHRKMHIETSFIWACNDWFDNLIDSLAYSHG